MIHRISPTADHLRAYIYQGLQNGYFTDFYENYEYDLEVENLYESEIEDLLFHDIPDYLLYFTETEREIDLDELAYHNYPILYTRLDSFNDHEGGLYKMECFIEQNYSLVTYKGVVLEDDCHDMRLGIDGLIEFRPLQLNIGWFYVKKVVNSELIELAANGDSLFFFPYTIDLHPFQDNFEPLPEYNVSSLYEVQNTLKGEPFAWKSLDNWYAKDVELAKIAISKDYRAIALCDKELRLNRDFCRSVIIDNGVVEILNYLSEEFTSDIEFLAAYYVKNEHLYFSLSEAQQLHPIIQGIREDYL